MAVYAKSDELKKLAEVIISETKPHLRKVMIGYVFREKAPVSKGRIIFGMTVRVDDRNHVFSGTDVIIEIGQDKWQLLPDILKKFVMDHELCHVGVELDSSNEVMIGEDGRRKVGVLPHDFEEFYEIQERYPQARNELRKLQAVWDTTKTSPPIAAKL